jgi:hypothetical protein
MLHSVLCNCIHFENCANSPLFKVFLPIIQAERTKFTRYDNFQGKLFIYNLTACLVANFKQPICSTNYSYYFV